jgi:hypothetical protein
MLQPSLENLIGYQTVILCYLEDSDNRIHEIDIVGHILPTIYPPAPKEWFITVDKGQFGKGTITVELAVIRLRFANQCKGNVGPLSKLRIQIQHQPYERGFDLDAWTGQLWSPVILVRLPDNWWNSR